ncbi:MAG: energy transducer TonB [Pseudomonadota bacterium]
MRISLVLVCLLASGALADESVRIDTGERVPQTTAVPKYPEKAIRDRIEGEVEVCFNVNRSGKPTRIAVRRSSHRLFERPSIRAVRESSYEPLPDDIALSGIKTCRTFRFFLDPVAIEDPTEID